MKKILIICEYFYPGYLAGGPIQSLVNLIAVLGKQNEIAVFTSAYDLGAKVPYEGFDINQWNSVTIGDVSCRVFYSTQPSLKQHQQILLDISPDFVYINGMYLPKILAYALWVRKQYAIGLTYIISPRGMLQRGAMSNKKLQKKLYLSVLKMMGLFKNCYWHATHSDEVGDVHREISKNANIRIAENIPKPPFHIFIPPNKEKGKLKLVYISIISAKKNLLFLLQTLQQVNANIELTIFGPIKDAAYWETCKEVMQHLPAHIEVVYKGDLQPTQVQNTICAYDALVLLTKGENFGHAIFESLSVGRPVITSEFTPWKDLLSVRAGWNLDIANTTAVIAQLESCANLNQQEWELFCKGAWQKAYAYFFHERDFELEYNQFFTA